MSSFHVRHDFHPTFARNAMLLLRLTAAANEDVFLEAARARDLEIGRRQSVAKIFASLRDLGLLENAHSKQKGQLRLTSLGRNIAEVAVRDELLFAELIHLRHWLLWHPETQGENFSWSYQMVCNILWDEAPTTIDSDRLVNMVLAAAEQQFGISGISFSTSSVSGILHWLRVLSPPCINEKVFRHRPACPPEALIVALEGIAVAKGHPSGIPLRIDYETREHACRATLLALDAFDDVLHQAEEALGVIRRSGDGGETLLIQKPLFEDLVPNMEQI